MSMWRADGAQRRRIVEDELENKVLEKMNEIPDDEQGGPLALFLALQCITSMSYAAAKKVAAS